MRKPSILFVSHSASRNGATLLLLETLKWLRKETSWETEVLMCGHGDLVEEFRSVCKTRVWRDPANLLTVLPGEWRARIARCMPSDLVNWYVGRSHYDLVYFNTSAVFPLVRPLSSRGVRSLWHIHELDYVLTLNFAHSREEELFERISRFVAVSGAVAETLNRRFRVPAHKIDVINGFVSMPTSTFEERAEARLRLRQQFGWQEDAFVVGACGSLGWRKGTDLFLQIARMCSQSTPGDTMRFLWIGGSTRDEILRFEHDCQALGLQDVCRLVPETDAVAPYYATMDAFALTSREDPFPLVMLEAAAYELPIVCFASTGGGPEFVHAGGGLTAGYLDVYQFAAHLQSLRENPNLRRKLGCCAAEMVKRRHVLETQGPKTLAAIQQCLSTSPQAQEVICART